MSMYVMQSTIAVLLFTSGWLVDHKNYGFAVFCFGMALGGMFIRLGDRLEKSAPDQRNEGGE